MIISIPIRASSQTLSTLGFGIASSAILTRRTPVLLSSSKSYPCPLWSSSFSLCLNPPRNRRRHISSSSSTMSTEQTNPLLEHFSAFPPFDAVLPSHVVPAVRSLLIKLETDLAQLENTLEPSWPKLVEPYEKIVDRLHVVWGIVNHLKAVKDSPDLRAAIDQVQPDKVKFQLRLGQSKPIFNAFNSIRNSSSWSTLPIACKRIVEAQIKEAVLNGVALPDDKREEFNKIEQELEKLSQKFGENVLDATKKFEKLITDKKEIDGLPPSALGLAAQTAVSKGHANATAEDGPWMITLDAPSFLPVMQHARNRTLREEVYHAYVTRASSGDLDNTPIIDQILKLKLQKAKLLGYNNYAEVSMVTKMATVDKAEELLEKLRSASWNAAVQDMEELKTFALEMGADEANNLSHWDINFWSERLRESKYDINEEELRPFFSLPLVMDGLFTLAKKLFNINIEPADGLASVWNGDVKFYCVKDSFGTPLAYFYFDPYSRPSEKRGGAWMDEVVSRSRVMACDGSSVRLPVAHMVCNQSPPVGSKPSLMTFREVETVFHEFGHALQHMLTKQDEGLVAGIRGIEWDAVELPSQFMENWCYHRDTLMSIAKHYETGECLPEEVYLKLVKARIFRAGSLSLRQIRFSSVDLELHSKYISGGSETIYDVDRRVGKKTQVIPEVEKVVMADAEKVVKVDAEKVTVIVEDVSPSEEEKTTVSMVDKIKVEGNTVGLDSEFVPKVEDNVEGDMKDTYDEEDKGERLELEDNDVEYEHDEDQGIDYDGKDVENAVEIQEEGDEYEDVEVEVGEDMNEKFEDEIGEDMNEKFEDEDEDEDEDGDKDENDEHEVDRADEEHHDFVRELRKRKEFELFVGGLDKDATEADLRKVFSIAGEITEVRLMMNPQTNKNKGFAFLRFATVEAAKRAASELKNPVINGKQCGVSPSQDSDTLFLGNISKSWSKEELKKKLKQYGIENIDDLTLVEDTNNKGMNRGFCFLEFSSRAHAMNAYRRLQRRDVVFGVDRSAKVAFADTFIEPDDEIMTQVTTVFIDGLSAAWDEDCVKMYLKKFGVIEKIELARNMPSAKRKDFGFVTFDSHDAAVACAEGINNAELGEGDNKAKVRSRLSRPHQRGRGKGTRGGHKISRGASLGGRSSRSKRRSPRKISSRPSRSIGVRGYGFKRPIKERRPALSTASRVRSIPPPARGYTRRPPVSSYPKNASKWDYGRRNEMPSRSRASFEYDFGFPGERRHSYIDEYASRGSAYSDVSPRAISRAAPKRAYEDEPYGRKLERPHTYRENRANDYYSFPGSKRPYPVVDDPSHRYSDVNLRHSRTRIDYGISESSHYVDSHGERSRRSHLGYGSSRGALSGHEPREFYSGGRQGMDYDIGFMRSNDGGMYPSSFGGGYMSRGSDVGGGSYSSMYSGRSLSGSGYMGGSDSGSYY